MSKSKIVIITFLLNKAFIPPLSNLEQILFNISNICSIEGVFEKLFTQHKCKIKKYRIIHKQKKGIITRIILLFYLNLRISIRLIRISKNVDLCIFFTGEWEFIPLITAKLLRKKVIWLIPSYLPHMIKYDTNVSSIVRIYAQIQKLSFILSDKIILHSNNLIEEWNLLKYKNKIVFANEYFINFDKFKININHKNRKNVVGFIGRLSKEKGIINFIHSIPLVLAVDPTISFIIIGDGFLQEQVKEYITVNGLEDKVKLISWVKSDEIPNFLNEFKLLVIPSYTESGPMIALESMACGTPILISRVGHAHTLIKDGKNGFLLKDNTSNNISENITKILNYKFLDEIAFNAYEMVKEEFSFEKTVEKWKDILGDLNYK